MENQGWEGKTMDFPSLLKFSKLCLMAEAIDMWFSIYTEEIFQIFIYLAVSNLSCSIQDLHCIMGSFAVLHRLSDSGTQAPEYMGSVVVSRLSCSGVCRILLPWSRIEPTSPALQGGVLTTGPLGKSLEKIFKAIIF